MNAAARRNIDRMTPRQLDALDRFVSDYQPTPGKRAEIGRYPTPTTRGMRHFFALRSETTGRVIMRSVRLAPSKAVGA